MDPSISSRFDIFEIYRRYCDIRSGRAYASKEEVYMQDDDSGKAKFTREALAELQRIVDSTVHMRMSIFDELHILMSRLYLAVDFSEFSRFYDFVFFISRENGQKNITVSKAVTAWRLVLAGRFRLLNEWCSFVERNQRHNISQDTWQQVLAFSRCVHENLEGYDPEGAWPVLIDDFVEYMYRVSGSSDNCNFFCNCGDPESQSCVSDDLLPGMPVNGLKFLPGLKRKFPEDIQEDKMETSDATQPLDGNLNTLMASKRRFVDWGYSISEGGALDGCAENARNNGPLGSSKCRCAVEGCLSKGFAGLFSSRSCLQFDEERTIVAASSKKSQIH